MSIIDKLFGSDDDDPCPTYVCTGCGKAFDDEQQRCPDCESKQIVMAHNRQN